MENLFRSSSFPNAPFLASGQQLGPTGACSKDGGAPRGLLRGASRGRLGALCALFAGFAACSSGDDGQDRASVEVPTGASGQGAAGTSGAAEAGTSPVGDSIEGVNSPAGQVNDGNSGITEGPGEMPLDDSGQEPANSGMPTSPTEGESAEDGDPPVSVEVLSTEPAVSGEVDVTVTLDAGVQFQTLVGFGASQVFYVDWITLNPNKDEIYNVLFRDLGLDVLRVGNWFQDRTIEDQQIQNTLEVAQRAEQSLGKKPTLVMSSWTPPADLKSNQQVAGGGTLAAEGDSFAYGAFGQWWRDSIQAYTAAGLVVDYASIQNEPDFTADYESARFGATEGAFAGYGQNLAAVRDSLSTLDAPPQLFGPEVIGLNVGNIQGYLDGLDGDDLDVVAHHLYNGGNPDEPDSYLGGMGQMPGVANGKPIFMSEFAPEEMGSGPQFFSTAWLIHNALTAESVSAYLYWALGWRDRSETQPVDPGLVTLEDPRPGATPFTTEKGYTINPTYYAVKHFSKWLDGGYQRVGAESNGAGLKASAYVSPDGSKLTTVLLNTDGQAHTVAVSPGSFVAGGATAFRTAGDVEQTARLSALGEGNSVTLPPQSVVTIVFDAAEEN